MQGFHRYDPHVLQGFLHSFLATMTKQLRTVLITSGLRRIANYFPTLSCEPVGIINWSDQKTTQTSVLADNKLTQQLYAKLRRREFANLSHLCNSYDLQYADINKKDGAALQRVLQAWECNLVITSNCSYVPTDALAHLSHGAINMHPSLLPDYRGAEPVLWQLAAGEPMLATTIHRLSDKYDCGGIVAQDRMARPTGASRHELADITETQLGKQLLNKAIHLLTENPTFAGKQQPEKSATPYAGRLSVEEFGLQYPLEQFTPQTVWDLIHYFGQCPMAWLDNASWQNKVTWVPAQMHDVCDRSVDETCPPITVNQVPMKWQSNQRGLTTRLVCNEVQIDLKPRWRSLIGLLKF